MSEIALVQTSLVWEDAPANRNHIDQMLGDDLHGVDLIILPEMFSTGFSMASERLAETERGETLDWMKATADRLGSHICGSLIIRDQEQCYNRFYLVAPDGNTAHYDKRHLFRMSDEHQHYAAGTQRELMSVGNLHVMPQICYDLRFPVFSRNDLGFDLIIYVANWPAARREHWHTLLRARAIENLCYVVGVNRVGTDGNNIEYAGDSALIDFNGVTLVASGQGKEVIKRGQIHLDDLNQYRQQFPAWQDADRFSLKD